MEKQEVVSKFRELANTASYHFADDSGREWQSGYAAQRQAEELFAQYPEFQEDLRQAAKSYLWSFNK